MAVDLHLLQKIGCVLTGSKVSQKAVVKTLCASRQRVLAVTYLTQVSVEALVADGEEDKEMFPAAAYQ